jgi:flap endonuclease-1
MGIKGLNEFLRKTCPHVFETVHLSSLAYKRVAIDTSLYMCRYRYSHQEKWLTGFIKLVSCLRKHNIHCVFIYDTSAPIEKEAERARRADQRQKNAEKLDNLEIALENYRETGVVDPILLLSKKTTKAAPVNMFLSVEAAAEGILNPGLVEALPAAEGIDVSAVEDKISKMQASTLNVTPEDYELTRELFDILHIPYYLAPCEAETTCADLCVRELVDYVLSEDTDVLAYGTPLFLSKIDIWHSTCVLINHEMMLESLGLTKSEFIDFCCLSGNDYNSNMPKIGPKRAFALLTKYRTIEAIRDEGKFDVEILNHVRTRELFTDYERLDVSVVPYCRHPDFEKLAKLLAENGLFMNLEDLKENFESEIVFLSGSDDDMSEDEK